MSDPSTCRTRVPGPGRVCPPVLALAAALALGSAPAQARAQLPVPLSVSGKAGSTGLGGDVAVAVTPRITLRGGAGWLPFEYDGTFDDQDYSVEPPGSYFTLGADVRLVGPLRLMGGLLHRSEPVRFDADLQGEAQIGDQTYTSEGRLEGQVHSARTAPYLGLGLGHAAGGGVGVYLDLAVAFTGDPDLELEASGPITGEPGFQAELERERARAEEDLDSYYRYWPVVSFGVRFGLGG